MDIRIGQGLDVHPFGEGHSLVLGGVTIPHTKGLVGHSDADALTHAVMDAVLGAAGKADIGHYFPDTDPALKGADSIKLLSTVLSEIQKEGWHVVNVDSTLLLQAPKIASYMPAMKQNLARALQIEESRIGIKATTTEKLGFVGREEGVLASAVVLLSREANENR